MSKQRSLSGFGVVMAILFWVYPSVVGHKYNPFLVVLAALVYGLLCGAIFDRLYNWLLPSLRNSSTRIFVVGMMMVVIAGLAYVVKVWIF